MKKRLKTKKQEKTKTKKQEKTKTKKQEKKKVIKTNKTEDEKKVLEARTFDEDLSKTFMTLKEVDELGTYKKIEKIPDGMFKVEMSSKGRAQKAMMKMYDVFVRKKNLMEKYPEDLMRAMGYFEFFYMQQLEDEKKTIKKFKEKYPDISKGLKKKMQSLYSLNQARKSMREAMALTLDDDPEIALERYMLMYNFLGQGEKETHKLTKNEKKTKKRKFKI